MKQVRVKTALFCAGYQQITFPHSSGREQGIELHGLFFKSDQESACRFRCPRSGFLRNGCKCSCKLKHQGVHGIQIYIQGCIAEQRLAFFHFFARLVTRERNGFPLKIDITQNRQEGAVLLNNARQTGRFLGKRTQAHENGIDRILDFS